MAGLTKVDAVWGIGIETTVGTAVDATAGLPNINQAGIKAGSSWDETRRATGKTVPTTDELKASVQDPTWAPQSTLSSPLAGMLAALCVHNASEAGAGPYAQTVEPDTAASRSISVGDTVSTALLSATLWEKLGQTTNRDIAAAGAIVSRVDWTFPETGLAQVTPTFMALKYDDDDDGSGGTFTMPGVTSELLTQDFVCKIGDGTPAALYAKEWAFSLIANVVVKRYGGQNALLPYRFVIDGWTLEGTFSKPIVSDANRLSEDYVVDGGGVGSDLLMYVYSRTLTDYSEASSSFSAGEMRFTLNIKLNDPDIDLSDETLENVSFSGIEDGTNNIFLLEQASAASQSWAV